MSTVKLPLHCIGDMQKQNWLAILKRDPLYIRPDFSFIFYYIGWHFEFKILMYLGVLKNTVVHTSL